MAPTALSSGGALWWHLWPARSQTKRPGRMWSGWDPSRVGGVRDPLQLPLEEGKDIVRRCLGRNQPGPYQIRAAINAVHSFAPNASGADWSQVVRLYDQLLVFDPSPVVSLHRAVAVAELDGPGMALALVDGLELDRYYLFHAVRADLLRRLQRPHEAQAAYEAAISRTENETERTFLQGRCASLRTA